VGTYPGCANPLIPINKKIKRKKLNFFMRDFFFKMLFYSDLQKIKFQSSLFQKKIYFEIIMLYKFQIMEIEYTFYFW